MSPQQQVDEKTLKKQFRSRQCSVDKTLNHDNIKPNINKELTKFKSLNASSENTKMPNNVPLKDNPNIIRELTGAHGNNNSNNSKELGSFQE